MTTSQDMSLFRRYLSKLNPSPYDDANARAKLKIQQAIALPEGADELTSSESVVRNMQRYGLETVEREFANCIDGLKKVHRRIVTTFGTMDKPHKCYPMVGRVLELHPHGDSSIYEAMCKLMQPFNTVLPLVEPHGGEGSYADPTPAGARYLEANSSPFARDVFFNGVARLSLPTRPAESGKGVEVGHYIPRLPMTLLTGNFGIGIGFKSEIPVHELSCICDLVESYIKAKKELSGIARHYKKFSRLLLPDFTSHCLIRNSAEIISKLERGEFNYTVQIDGILEVLPGLIIVRTLPPQTSPSKLEKKLIPMLRDKNSWIGKNFQAVLDTSSGMDYAEIRFMVKRGRDPFALLEPLKRIIRFSKSWKPIWHWADLDARISHRDPYQLLADWYDARYKSIQTELKSKQEEYLLKLRELDAMLKVRDHSVEIVQAFDNAKEDAQVVSTLCKKFQLTEWQVAFLFKLKLEQLTAKGKGKLQDELDEVRAKKLDLIQQTKMVPERITADAQYFKRVYAKGTESSGSKSYRKGKLATAFQGYVKVTETGIIQFFNIEELKSILAEWGADGSIHMFNPTHKFKYLLTDTTVSAVGHTDLPQSLFGTKILTSVWPLTNIVVFSKDTGGIFRVNGIGSKLNSTLSVTPVGKRLCTAIYESGKVTTTGLRAIPIRKTINSVGIKNDILAVSSVAAQEMVIIHGNTEEPNKVRLSVIKGGEGKLVLTPIGDNKILWVGALADPVHISIPDSLLRRAKVKHLWIPNVEEIMDGKEKTMLTISGSNNPSTIRLTKHPAVPKTVVAERITIAP